MVKFLLLIFIVLTSIPFVLICFLLVRLVAALSLKDVLHLSLYRQLRACLRNSLGSPGIGAVPLAASMAH